MAKMNWAQLLNTDTYDNKQEQAERPSYVIAADRITFSASFRRLANKTQVHPLYDNDHLRHRLIHSEEVASVGRSIGMQVGVWLEAEKLIPVGDAHKIAGVIQAACLAHDVGNPPFGHSGEEAIGKWCAEQLHEGTKAFAGIARAHWHEFEKFEGNAQGLRILTRLEMYRNEGGMCMPNAVLGAFMKYPMGAETHRLFKESPGTPYVGAKKFGFFESERAYFETAARAMGLHEAQGLDGQSWWRRHPLVYLVEAADDICYNIVDLEDGYSAGDLSYKTVEDLLSAVAIPTRRNQADYSEYERISYLRARAIGGAINACVQAFKDNYDAILEGQFSDSLIGVSSKAREFKAIKDLAHQQLFTAPRKTRLEVKGRNVIRKVLDGLCPVYEALARNDWDENALPDYEKQLVNAVQLDLRDATDPYTALHSLTDFVSGMTDRYAVQVSEMLSG